MASLPGRPVADANGATQAPARDGERRGEIGRHEMPLEERDRERQSSRVGGGGMSVYCRAKIRIGRFANRPSMARDWHTARRLPCGRAPPLLRTKPAERQGAGRGNHSGRNCDPLPRICCRPKRLGDSARPQGEGWVIVGLLVHPPKWLDLTSGWPEASSYGRGGALQLRRIRQAVRRGGRRCGWAVALAGGVEGEGDEEHEAVDDLQAEASTSGRGWRATGSGSRSAPAVGRASMPPRPPTARYRRGATAANRHERVGYADARVAEASAAVKTSPPLRRGRRRRHRRGRGRRPRRRRKHRRRAHRRRRRGGCGGRPLSDGEPRATARMNRHHEHAGDAGVAFG